MNIPVEDIKKALSCLAQCKECKGTECDYYMEDNPVCNCDNIEIAKNALDYIEQLENKCQNSRWISIKEEKPSKELLKKYATVYLKDGFYIELPVMIKGAEFPTTLLYDGKTFFDYDYNSHKVTHWMHPLEAPVRKEMKK